MPDLSPKMCRITTRYIEPEDRIRLAGEFDGGAPVVIWLTQRLIHHLLPVLLRWLEDGVRPAIPSPAVQTEIQQSFAQQAARACQERLPAVSVTHASATWLATEVRIEQFPSQIRLIFGGTGSQQAMLELTATPLRQWLNIIYDHSQSASWPLEAWPEWIKESKRPLPKQGVILH